jgi:hypothetical protein
MSSLFFKLKNKYILIVEKNEKKSQRADKKWTKKNVQNRKVKKSFEKTLLFQRLRT